MSSKTLFTWIHISDIHIGHGDSEYQENQSLVLRSLRGDIKHVSQNFSLIPNAIFVTGDIAFSANTRNTNEYKEATEWLTSVGSLVGLSNKQIYVIPGNHDVQRNFAKDDGDINRWLEDIRRSPRKLGNLLNAPEKDKDRQRLVQRMQNYLEFSAQFAPYNKVSPPENSSSYEVSIHDTRLFWTDLLTVSDNWKLRVVGYNSALLSQDDNDKNNLALSETQLNYPFKETQKDEIILIMSHHPFDWLASDDAGKATTRTNRRADLHLYGHIHEQQTWSLRVGNGTGLVKIVSGAAHGELEKDPKTPPKHAYNWVQLEEGTDGGMFLKIYPRIWVKAVDEFRIDGELTLKDHRYAQLTFTPKAQSLQPSTPGLGSRAKPIDPGQMLLGSDIADGQQAVEALMKKGDAVVPDLIEMFKHIDEELPITHLEQVLYRFKILFARFDANSSNLLCDLVCDDNWRIGSRAAQCFDFFSDPKVKVLAANRLAKEFCDSSAGGLLDYPDPVRNSIKALGYIGAYEWGYAIADVLSKTKEDPKFRHWSFIAYAWMNVKLPPSKVESLSYIDLNDLFEGFNSGKYSVEKRPVTNEEIELVKKIIGLRKDRRQADFYLRTVKYHSWFNYSSAAYMARECYAHMLGSMHLQTAIPILKEIIINQSEPTALRVESALSLSRIKHKKAATALREAAEAINIDLSTQGYQDADYNARFYALLGLSQVSHLSDDPATNLEYAVEQLGIKDFHIGELVRAVGLCKASKYSNKVEALLDKDNAELRGQAALALARLHGAKVLPHIKESMESCTSAIDGILFSLAILESGDSPDIELIKNCLSGKVMEPGIVEWSSPIIEDTFQILDKSSEEYQQLVGLWRGVIESLPPKLPFIYTNISSTRRIALRNRWT